MALRSSPVALVPVLTRTGKRSFRVTGTIHGDQRKRLFANYEDAAAQRDAWEIERIGAAAAMRPKVTRLTQAQLIESEACFELLKGEPLSLTDVVKAALRNPPQIQCQLTFVAAYKEFLPARKRFISEAQYGNYESPCRRLGIFLGERVAPGNCSRYNLWALPSSAVCSNELLMRCGTPFADFPPPSTSAGPIASAFAMPPTHYAEHRENAVGVQRWPYVFLRRTSRDGPLEGTKEDQPRG